jgi:hypothetical protein
MKNVPLLASVIAAIIAFPTAQAAEHFTLIAEKPIGGVGTSATIKLNAGDTAQLIFATGSWNSSFRMVATVGGSAFEIPARVLISTPTSGVGGDTTNPVKIVGPGEFKMRLGYEGNPGSGAEKGFATVEVNRAGTASNATSIPLEAGTTWQVTLEASTDLTNWAAVPPGDYPSASPQRFFRTRLVKRP